MKNIAILLIAFFTTFAQANVVNIANVVNGSGSPGNDTVENAVEVSNGIMHAPQYLPGYPTAATIWPRVIDVPCTQTPTAVVCNGYQWAPSMGRGEYLFFKPHIVVPVAVEEKREEPKMTPVPEPLKQRPKIIKKRKKNLCVK